MAIYAKGTIGFIPVVEQINRKFTIRANKSKAKDSLTLKKGAKITLLPATYMGAGTTVMGRAGVGTVSKNYLFMRERNRQSGFTTAEVEGWSTFEAAAKGRNAIMRDLMQMTPVQELWLQAIKDERKTINGVSAAGYTIRGWVFAVQYAGGKATAGYDYNKFPTAFDA